MLQEQLEDAQADLAAAQDVLVEAKEELVEVQAEAETVAETTADPAVVRSLLGGRLRRIR